MEPSVIFPSTVVTRSILSLRVIIESFKSIIWDLFLSASFPITFREEKIVLFTVYTKFDFIESTRVLAAFSVILVPIGLTFVSAL